ncbi:two-component regulator propeller domain-containing protein [Flavobacterium fluviatile]|uniref:two-component regulator propeller domain-containing protein n=1 Tax=Flavobacterium fluviatile TaxID=1862387 RepID=UPI0013D07C39|nr:two-component regulator propeller domain-containing protein [Flavobacterium fluviatile]
MISRINYIIFLCFISFNVFSQFDNLKFENLDTPNGLSSSTCLDIFQDKEGYLWFGTIDGLNKYNGYNFEIFRPILNDSTSISSIRVNAITEDRLGNLWIGTNNGLNFLNKKTNKFSRVNIYSKTSVASNTSEVINELLFDNSTNVLWVATNNGLVKISLAKDYTNLNNLKKDHFVSESRNKKSIDNNTVNLIVKDKNNTIWVGTNGEHLNKYNPTKNNFDRIYIQKQKQYELNHLAKRVYIDSDGDFWIGNDISNIILWKPKAGIFTHIAIGKVQAPIQDLYQDKNGILWASTDGEGLFLYNKKQGRLQQHLVNNPLDAFSLPNNQPSTIYEDHKGIFWIGSYDKGVSKLDPSKYSFGHYYYKSNNINGLNGKIIQSVLQDSKNRIWLSAYNGGLNLFDEKNNSFQHFAHTASPNSISSNKILYTFESADKNIWVCTLDGGLNKFNPDTHQVQRFYHNESDPHSIGQNSVWAGVEDNKKRIWLGLRSEGLNIYNPADKKFYSYKSDLNAQHNLLSNFVFSLFIDSKNRLFVGTTLGVNMVYLNKLNGFIPKKINFSEINVNGIKGQRINYITEDHLGNIWVGADSGIYQLDANLKLVKSYNSQNGLPNNLVVGIKEDNQHNLWITTKSGMSLLNPKTGHIRNFNIHDGLQGTEFQSKSIEKTRDGRIIVGGINGFNIFNPKDITIKSSVKLTPKITSFRLNNKKIEAGDLVNGRILLKESITQVDEMVLDYNENYISFEFLALYFENPEQVQYSYKLVGLEKEFVNVGSRRDVNYSNLLPGEYTFEVKASIDGKWENAKTAQITFKILSPPWKTWWAYLLYIIFGMGLVWFFMNLYQKYIQDAQEHKLDLMKIQFFVNVSHEFRTPLTLILNPLDKILGNITDPDIIKSSTLSAQRSARRLLHLVNQLLDYRKMDAGMAPLQVERGDFVKFTENIFVLFKGLAEKKEITYKFESGSKRIVSLFDFDKVEKIITNLISNAIKFTNNGGEIKVSVEQVDSFMDKKPMLFGFKTDRFGSHVKIVVKDTGIGMDKEQLENVFTRFYNLDVSKSGTGIGLNFTKALVEMHKGKISVKSSHKKGTKFTVRIPIDNKGKSNDVENIKNEFLINSMKSVEYEMLISNENITRELSKTTLITSKSLTVLIVEDNRELRAHLKDDLKDVYTVKEAVNGEEGLKMARKYFPDIIISDVMMPKMDGFEMCRILKSEFETCHIPIILLTARNREEDLISGYTNGAEAYLPKPFKMKVLKVRIQNLLEAKERLRKRFSEIGGISPSREITTNNLDEVFLDRATKVVMDNISDIDFKQEDLLKSLGIGKSQFYRKINSLTGNNPSYFIRTIRLKYASELLQQNTYSIKEVTHLCGFNSTAYFSKTFKELFNVTPTEFIETAIEENKNTKEN